MEDIEYKKSEKIKVNGITFYYDPNNLDINGFCKDGEKTVSIKNELYEFSQCGELDEECYSIFLDDLGELVIF